MLDSGDSAEVLRQLGLTPSAGALDGRSSSMRASRAARFGRKAYGRRHRRGRRSRLRRRDDARKRPAFVRRRVQADRPPTSTLLLLLGGIACRGSERGTQRRPPAGWTIPGHARPRAERSPFAGQPVKRRAERQAHAEHRALRHARRRCRVDAIPCLACRRRPRPTWTTQAGATSLSPALCRPAPRSTSRSTRRRSTLARSMPATQAKLDFSLAGDQLQVDLNEAAFAGGS